MKLMTLLLLLFSLQSQAVCNKNPIKIAVLDSGFGYMDRGHIANLCRIGHKDFSIDKQFTSRYDTDSLVPLDMVGHGTNVVGIIDGYARKSNANYCIVVIKYYSERQTGEKNLLTSVEAIRYATDIGANIINYSGGGPESDEGERLAVKRFIDRGGKFVAAAGNDHSDLDLPENAYYPAMEDRRIIVVGNQDINGVKLQSSNYGNVVKRWEVGENVTAYGLTMTGTSQATAIATGKIIAESYSKCDIGY